MKYAEFNDWCNERASDGCWSMVMAIQCCDIHNEINALPRRKREEKFQKIAKRTNLVEVINNINEHYNIEKRYIIEEPEKKSIIQKIKDWITGHGSK